jgi:hypothetical protein
MSSATFHARPAFLRGTVCVMLAHFLAVLVLAASPHTHDLVHHDAHQAAHHCAATDMLSGGTGDGLPVQPFTVAAILPQQFFSVAEFDPRWIASLFLTGCVLEHAPPAQA